MMRRMSQTGALDGPRDVKDLAVRLRGWDPYVLAVGLVGVASLWIRPLWSSLWLDETGTFWLIQGSLADVFDRALDLHGQSPLYPVLMWVWIRALGTSEIALRLPSLIAAAVATWLCYRLAWRLFEDVSLAALAACILALHPFIAFAAGDARPYTLALAALLAATLMLVRWLEKGRVRDAAASLLLMAVTLYLHYLFALALAAHMLLAHRVLRRRRQAAWRPLTLGALILVVLMVPSMPHFIGVFQRRQLSSLVTFGSVPELLAWVVPPALVISFLAGRFASFPDEPVLGWHGEVDAGKVRFLVLWLLIPPVTVYIVGSASGIGLYAPRHFLSSAPALALLGALACAALSPRRRRVAVAVLGILTVLSYGAPVHTTQDWRGAAETVNALVDSSDSLVLAHTGFAESADMGWILDDRRSQSFLAPFAAYPIEGRTYPLPYSPTEEAREYVSHLLADTTFETDQIVLICPLWLESYESWLDLRVSTLGFSRRDTLDLGDIRVIAFGR
jgi:mannosyltransferase